MKPDTALGRSCSLPLACLFLAVTTSLITSTLPAPAASELPQATVQVVKLVGTARYSTDQVNWLPLKQNQLLKPGTSVQPGSEPGTIVDLAFGGRGDWLSAYHGPYAAVPPSGPFPYRPTSACNHLRLWPGTALTIRKAQFSQTGLDVHSIVLLELQSGRLSGRVGQLSGLSRYQVKLPGDASATTDYGLYDLNTDGQFRVLSGSLTVAYPGPNQTPTQRQIPANQAFDLKTQQLTPLSQPDLAELKQLSHALYCTQAGLPVYFARDITIEYVTPIRGLRTSP